MARKKVETNFQTEVQTNSEWEMLLNREGLIVIDVYQSYTGPLKALESRLRALNNTLGDDNLKFALAKADDIDALQDYKGSCEPCFLFYAGKQLVAVVRGANAPVIIRTIQEQLAHENKVLKGEAQRKPIVDTVLQEMNVKKQEDEAERLKKVAANALDSGKEVTICIIKPDMISKGKKSEILQKIEDCGYVILEEKDVRFNEEMVREFYKNKQDSPNFNDLINYMTSGESCVLALGAAYKNGNVDVVSSWRSDLDDDSDESFRAQYATDQIINGLHGSDSREEAIRELAFFFSDKIKEGKYKQTQRTLALIRPSALAQHKDQIIHRIKNSGFEIAMTRTIQFDRQQAEEFYAEQKDKPFFEDLITEMTSGPMMVLCLIKENSIEAWRNLLGPKEKGEVKEAVGTLRNEFDVAESPVNALHGPSNKEQAERELKMFFPLEQTVAIIKPDIPAEQRKTIRNEIKRSGFIIKSKKSEKLTEDIAKEIYKNSADKPYFNELVSLMTSGETDIYMLSRENAIEGWREIIGPVDPAKAKEENPNSLRGLFGVDILHNGLHGPSNKEQVENEINLFFNAS